MGAGTVTRMSLVGRRDQQRPGEEVVIKSVDAEINTLLSKKSYSAAYAAYVMWPKTCTIFGIAVPGSRQPRARPAGSRPLREGRLLAHSAAARTRRPKCEGSASDLQPGAVESYSEAMSSSEQPKGRAEARPLSEPVRFGAYLLLKRIAVGGMSEVYLAKPAAGSSPAAELVIKRLLPSLLDDPRGRKTFEMEASLHAAARHPNVVEVFEAGEVDGEPYLAMEYVAGVDAFRLMRRAQSELRRIPAAMAVHIARELCKALARVHRLTDQDGNAFSIVHRDVTPSNIYLSDEGDVKLGDFGIARSIADKPRVSGQPCPQGQVRLPRARASVGRSVRSPRRSVLAGGRSVGNAHRASAVSGCRAAGRAVGHPRLPNRSPARVGGLVAQGSASDSGEGAGQGARRSFRVCRRVERRDCAVREAGSPDAGRPSSPNG